jgi:hypothetical protein
MRKAIAAVIAVAAMSLTTTTAFAADKHPPKFGVNDNQCTATADQPWCPGHH